LEIEMRASIILSVLLIAVFLGSTFAAAPGLVSSASAWVANPAASQVNPVLPISVEGFSNVGALAPSTPILVTVAVPLNNLALAQSLEASISNPDSPQFRHFLSQETIQQDFLPVSQYQSVLNYLKSNGFTISLTAEDSIIVASTTVENLKSTLGLETNLYSNGTESYYSSSGAPTLSGIYLYSSNVTSLVVQHPSVVLPNTALNVNEASQSVPNVTSPDEGFQASSLLSTYNATSLVSNGDNGRSKTIGILEFGGTPYMAQELQAYDRATGLPAPPSFTITPIGPYQPKLGYADVEEELDVEFSHAMAPRAGIDLYIANGALNWAPIIALVDQQDKVSVLSQSWSDTEESFLLGPGFFNFNIVLGDQYFLLGSLEGITFLCSSGDTGGTGFAGQPLGSQFWPATSPYVTAVGGTQTYLTFKGSTVTSSLQTAWSNEGFEPSLANFGGSTGGVSSVEPKPWYQDSIATPTSYVNGRMTPDVSLQAGVPPGTYVLVDRREVSSSSGYVWLITGGTSEASPLLAGLLCDIDTAISGTLGSINPAIYRMGQSSLYSKEFTPITFGYNSPWVEKSGYNLITGWGAPNIGDWESYFSTHSPGTTPGVQVSISNSAGRQQFEFTSGQEIVITAWPTPSTTPGTISSTNTYTAKLVTLEGAIASTTLKYNQSLKAWRGLITVPSEASGLTNVNVAGEVGGMLAFGFAEVFTGYLATIISPLPKESFSQIVFVPSTSPWSSAFGFKVKIGVTDLKGDPVTKGSYSFTASSYSISTNTYMPFVKNEPLKLSSGLFSAILKGNYPLAPVIIAFKGVFGFICFQNGVSLLPSFIVPPNNAEPGTVSPGQFLQILGELQAPLNTPNTISMKAIQLASKITATLVSPTGNVVSSVNVRPSAPSSFFGYPVNFLGYLHVPSNAPSGFYTIRLQSSFKSRDGVYINGSYFGQVYVAPQPAIVPRITLTPNPVKEGQNVQIRVNIAYANGTEVKYGMYSATLYPARDANNYAYYSGLPAGEIPLRYDPALNLWVGNVVMPSRANLGWIGGNTYFYQGLFPGIVTSPVSGLWYAYVSGVSADGVPTTTNISAQQGFTVDP
jgi:subtilase family serine protease